MFRNALDQTHADFSKSHRVFLFLFRKLHHHFWQEIRKIRVIKCPPNSFPKGDIESHPNLNLKDDPNTNTHPKIKTRQFRLRFLSKFV